MITLKIDFFQSFADFVPFFLPQQARRCATGARRGLPARKVFPLGKKPIF